MSLEILCKRLRLAGYDQIRIDHVSIVIEPGLRLVITDIGDLLNDLAADPGTDPVAALARVIGSRVRAKSISDWRTSSSAERVIEVAA